MRCSPLKLGPQVEKWRGLAREQAVCAAKIGQVLVTLPPNFRVLEHDRRDQAAVIGFFRVRAAAIGIKTIRVAIGAVPRPFRMAHARRAQTVQAKASKVKLHAAVCAIGEIAGVCRVFGQKGIDEFRTDFIGALADARADDRSDIFACRP